MKPLPDMRYLILDNLISLDSTGSPFDCANNLAVLNIFLQSFKSTKSVYFDQ